MTIGESRCLDAAQGPRPQSGPALGRRLGHRASRRASRRRRHAEDSGYCGGQPAAGRAGATTCSGDDQAVTEHKARPASKPFVSVVVLVRPEDSSPRHQRSALDRAVSRSRVVTRQLTPPSSRSPRSLRAERPRLPLSARSPLNLSVVASARSAPARRPGRRTRKQNVVVSTEGKVERETRLELATFCLGSRRSAD